MSILKTLRKSYFAMFLALLMLFTSCNPDSLLEDSDIQTEILTLDDYVAKHIDLTSKISKLTSLLNYKDIEKLVEMQKKSIETSSLKRSFKDEGINISTEMIELQLKIDENTKKLFNNPKYNSLNEEEFLLIITNEIKNQFNKQPLIAYRINDCDEAFDEANGECLEEFAAAAATVGVIGLITTFGVGSIIGGGIALIRFGECNKNAQAELAACRENQ